MIIFTDSEIKNEIWKDVPDYEGLYQVSDLGRVKSYNRKRDNWKILSHGVYDKYVIKTLCNNIGQIKKQVHRIVMLVFKGESDLFVDHINGIRSDNRLSNLRYVNHRENITYYFNRVKEVGYKFISSRNKWSSNIRIEKEQYFLGYFDTKEEAIYAYNNALDRWKNNKEVPYEINKNTNEEKSVYYSDTLNMFFPYFQKGGYKIHLGYYKTKIEALKIIKKANEDWSREKIVPFYVNFKNSSIYKYIYYIKRTNKWNLKINGRIRYFNTQEEAINILVGFKSNGVFSNDELITIEKYYTEDKIKNLKELFLKSKTD